MKKAWAGSIALTMAVAWACGGGDDTPNANALTEGGTNGSSGASGSGGSSGTGPGGSSGTVPGDGGSGGIAPSATSLEMLREPFARLGVIGSRPSADAPREWRLRVYRAGPSRAEDGYWCSEPVRAGECITERCEAEEEGPRPDAGTELWSGTVTITDENTGTSIVTDLAALGRSTTVQIGEVLALPTAAAGHVLHVRAPNVSGLPPIDVRATIPSDPRIQLTGTLEGPDAGAFAHVPEPGTLRVDMSIWQGFPPRRSASCFFDRAAGALSLPPIDSVDMSCDQENIRMVPVGQWMTVIEADAGPQALVYVGTADLTHAFRVIDCNQLFGSN